MSITPGAKEHLDELSKTLAAMATLTPKGLVRREQLGDTLAFNDFEELFAAVLEIASLLEETSLDGVSEDALRQLSESANSVRKALAQIAAFNANDGGPLRLQIANNLANEFNAFFRVATPVIAFKRNLGVDVAALEEETRDFAAEVQRNLGREFEAVRMLKEEAEETVEAVRDTAAKVGIAHHAEVFDNEATRHSRWALGWLLITALIAAGTARFAWWNVQQYAGSGNVDLPPLEVSIQLAVAKIVLFSVLYFALIGAARIYRAHRHNAVVNAHRRNALKTFQAFAKAASGDPDIKNAVLLKATETIFSHASTGYLAREPESQGSPQVLEIIRSALRTGSDDR